MAGGNTAQAIAEQKEMHVTLGKTTQGMGKALIKFTAMFKLLPNLTNTFFKGRRNIRVFSDVLGKGTKAVEDMGEAVKVAGGPFILLLETIRLITTGMVAMVGIVFGLMTAVYALSASLGDAGNFAQQMKEKLSGVMENIQPLIDRFNEFTATLEGTDYTPYLEGARDVFTNLLDVAVMVLDFYTAAYAAIIVGILEIYDYLKDTGAFDRLWEAISGLWNSVKGVFEALMGAQEDGESGFQKFKDGVVRIIGGLVSWLIGSGLIDFVVNLTLTWIAVFKFIVDGVAFAMPAIKFIASIIAASVSVIVGAFDVAITFIIGIFNTLMTLFLEGPDEAKVVFFDMLDSIQTKVSGWVDTILEFLAPLFEAFDAVSGFVGGAVSGAMETVGLSSGGVVSGPKSGYPVALHGTEAVVPLPDGRTIPVSIKGAGAGGGSATFNITVNGAKGEPREIAKMVGQEVQRAFRGRSRGGGYGRGVI